MRTRPSEISERFLTSPNNFLPVVDEADLRRRRRCTTRNFLNVGFELSSVIAGDIMREPPACRHQNQHLSDAAGAARANCVTCRSEHPDRIQTRLAPWYRAWKHSAHRSGSDIRQRASRGIKGISDFGLSGAAHSARGASAAGLQRACNRPTGETREEPTREHPR